MDMTPRTPSRPLLWPDAVLDLQDALVDDPTPVYIVGGAVRDAYRHHPIHDIDLATPDNAIKLGRQIANQFEGNFFILDRERDIARVLLDDDIVIDVAALRGDTLLDDLLDRDFTINAMAVDLKDDLNQLIDPLNGEQDLQNKIIRRCADDAIDNDPIRMLRAVRQSVQFQARIEPGTLAAIRQNTERLWNTSPERIRDEFAKLMLGSRPQLALRVADTLDLLKVIIPEVEPLHDLEQPPPHVADAWGHTIAVVEKLNGILATISPERTDETGATFSYGMAVVALDLFREQLQAHILETLPEGRDQRWLLLLGALLHDVGKAQTDAPEFAGSEAISADIAERIANDLRLSNAEKTRLVTMIEYQTIILNMPAYLSDLDMHRFWYRFQQGGVDICLLTLADHLGMVNNEINQDVWLRLLGQVQILLNAYYNRYEEVVAPPQLLNGKELMAALDLEPGRKVGELLAVIREGQVTGEITSVEEALEAARAYL